MKTLTEKLKQKNLKVTPQRLAIYNILCNTTKHPSAEVIYKSLEQAYPTMSLATVYKTLDALKKAELIQELNVGEDSFRYDATITPHIHLVCKGCNDVYDFMCTEPLEQLKDDISNTTNFKINSEQIYFFGKCGNCK